MFCIDTTLNFGRSPVPCVSHRTSLSHAVTLDYVSMLSIPFQQCKSHVLVAPQVALLRHKG